MFYFLNSYSVEFLSPLVALIVIIQTLLTCSWLCYRWDSAGKSPQTLYVMEGLISIVWCVARPWRWVLATTGLQLLYKKYLDLFECTNMILKKKIKNNNLFVVYRLVFKLYFIPSPIFAFNTEMLVKIISLHWVVVSLTRKKILTKKVKGLFCVCCCCDTVPVFYCGPTVLHQVILYSIMGRSLCILSYFQFDHHESQSVLLSLFHDGNCSHLFPSLTGLCRPFKHVLMWSYSAAVFNSLPLS